MVVTPADQGLALPVEFTLFETVEATRGAPHRMPFRDFAEAHLSGHVEVESKKAVGLFDVCSHRGGWRGRGTVEAVHAVVLDVDADEAWDPRRDHAENLEGLAYAAYTTHSHAPGLARWRLVFPVTRPMAAREYRAVWQGVVALLGHDPAIDRAASDCTRISYLPSCAPGAEREAFLQEGAGIDPDEVAVDGGQDPLLTHHEPVPEEELEDSVRAAREALGHLSPDCEYNRWVGVGMALHQLGDAGLALWDGWSARSEKYPGREALEAKWAGFGSDGIGLGSLFHWAKANGWVDSHGLPPAEPWVIEFSRKLVADYKARVAAEDGAPGVFAGEVDIDSLRARALLATPPEPVDWLYEDFLQRGTVGLLAAAGGTGKSFFALQLSVCLAAGVPFMGLFPKEPRAVLYVPAEDSVSAVHRRLRKILRAMRSEGRLSATQEELAIHNLLIWNRTGMDNRLVTQNRKTREIEPTGLGDEIAAVALRAGVSMITLDPLSRFKVGDENDNETATRLIEVLERMRRDSGGATVLAAHHVTKNAQKPGTPLVLTQDSIRGASAFVDGARWAAMMATMPRASARKCYDVPPNEAHLHVLVAQVKGNEGELWLGTWMKRARGENGGVLVPCELKGVDPEEADQSKAEAREKRIREAVPNLLKVLEKKKSFGKDGISPSELRDSYHKAIGVSARDVALVVDLATEQGLVETSSSGNRRGDVVRIKGAE